MRMREGALFAYVKDMSTDVRSESLMTIAVTEVGHTFGRQTRAYADYRVFSSLARFSDIVRKVTVSLTSSPVDGAVRRLLRGCHHRRRHAHSRHRTRTSRE